MRSCTAVGKQGRPTKAQRRPRRPARQVATIRASLNTAAGTPWLKQSLKHVVESQQFSKEALRVIFDTAVKMESVKRGTPPARQLEGYIMATLFYEPSTRTRLSFESAMTRLGGSVLTTESAGEYSSAAKGETLEDTIRTMQGYSDAIVLRHSVAGSAKIAASTASVPILNAGDGPGQHPTQALLDAYTIEREVGRLDNISIGMIGDLANGRTVHSLAYMLAMYNNVKMYFIAPDVVRMKDDIKQRLTNAGVHWEETGNLNEVASEVDVLYQTRIQKERFKENPEDYHLAKGKYIISAETLKSLSNNAIIMHPLPRVDEITPEVDKDARAAYFRQARNGLFIRMALLKICLLGTA